jgi:hypothetical protein
MSFSIFFLFQFHGFKTCGLLLRQMHTKNRKFTTFYNLFVDTVKFGQKKSLVGKLNK